MTRTRKLTLSMREFSHLVSESLDFTNAVPCPHPLVDNTAVLSDSLQKNRHLKTSSFQRIFSRPTPTPGQREDFSQGPPEDLPGSPRKMSISWPFSRSPRKSSHTKDEGNVTQEVDEPEDYRTTGMSPYSTPSLVEASTSSLGSLVPVHERLFPVTDQEPSSENCRVFKVSCSSPVTIVPPLAREPLTASCCYVPLDSILGNRSVTSVFDGSTVEPTSGTSSQGSLIRASFEGTEASYSVTTTTERESVEEDPTPRAATFGSRAMLTSAESQARRKGRLSQPVPSRNVQILTLRPAVGVTPHIPSENESSVSLCSTSSLPSPIVRTSSPTFPATKPSESGTSTFHVPTTPPNARVPAMSLGIASSPSNLDSAPPLGFSPRQRKRAISRSLTPPPPPTGPLPAVPSSIPPVPPLPPLLSKISTNASPNSVVSSPPRLTASGTLGNPTSALPPSPPGGLRLPSRLSWVNSVRAVLPSPPASPTRPLKAHTKTLLLSSPSKADIKRPNELKRPTSIGVIEAADNVQVRRTKSILLLGSRSKSNVSLGTKRVQIHADVNVDPSPTAKPRRKSSAATVGHPISCSISGPVLTSLQNPELLVPRERRHSAPVLSRMDSKLPAASADWTLSLPFCTDVPGNKIMLSPLASPKLNPEQDAEGVQIEDWTLCMPLKTRVGTPTLESVEGPDGECTLAETAETVEAQPVMQLPTPSPSPTWPTPASAVLPLDPEDSELSPEERPASPASLGPHVGGLDLASGRGKRASGWHVYGWFDEVCVPENENEDEDEDEEEDEAIAEMPATPASVSDYKSVKSHVTVFRKTHDTAGRHPSQDSVSTVTSGATFYSARSCLLAN